MIESLKMTFNHLPGCWGIKDNNSIFQYANEEYRKIMGLDDKFEFLGKTDFQIPNKISEFAPLFQSQDHEVITTRKNLTILGIHQFNEGLWKGYIFTKMPWYENNLIAGTIFHGRDITSPSLIELGSLLENLPYSNMNKNSEHSYFYLSKNTADIKLNSREEEVIFFLLRGKSAKLIANILNLSVRTIEEYVNNLKYKFTVNSKAELIEKAVSLGFLKKIPDSLFRQELCIILKES